MATSSSYHMLNLHDHGTLNEYLVFRKDFFSFQFRQIRYKRIGYNVNVMRQSACLVFILVTVDNYTAFFNCSVRLYDGLASIHFSWLGPELLVCCLAYRVSASVFVLLRISISCFAPKDLHRQAVHCICESPFFIHFGGYHTSLVFL